MKIRILRMCAACVLGASPVLGAPNDLKLLLSDGAPGDLFGTAIAISGSTAIVGAYRDDDNGSASCSAYLFDTTSGTQIAKLLHLQTKAETPDLQRLLEAEGMDPEALRLDFRSDKYLFDLQVATERDPLFPGNSRREYAGMMVLYP